MRIAPEDVDAVQFAHLIEEATTASRHDPARAVRLLQQALGLWRGDPLPDLADRPRGMAERARLVELKHLSEDRLFAARMQTGEDAGLVADLELAVTAQPYRERRWGYLMTSLYRSGRQADALATFDRIRRLLDEELGLQPSSELVELERSIRAQDPAMRTRVPSSQSSLPIGTVTFLLTDVEESTPLWQAAPEAMTAAMERHFELLYRAISVHGGVRPRDQGEGDSVLAAFSLPSDAIRAALAAQLALQAEQWPTPSPVRVRMGVHTGEAQLRDETNYAGLTIIRAARLRSVARGGQIVISATTRDLIVDRLEPPAGIVDVGLHRLKGLTRPEPVFALTHPDLPTLSAVSGDPTSVGERPVVQAEPEPAPVRQRVLPHPVAAAVGGVPLVGRDKETERLRLVWEGVTKTSEPAIAVVQGDAGIGKTRLAAEFAVAVHVEGGLVLWGRCDEDAGLAYWPLVDVARQWALAAPPGRVVAAGIGEEFKRLVPELRSASEAPGPAGPTGDPEVDRLRLFEGARAVLAAAAAQGPILVVIDDLHWAGTSTVLMLRHVLHDSIPAPIMFLLTYSNSDLDAGHALTGVLADLRRNHRVTWIGLGGLSEPDVEQFLESAYGHPPLDGATRQLARHLHAQSGGNAFFVEQLVRHLNDTGRLFHPTNVDPPSWVQDGSDLPEGIRELISRRTHRLTEEANEALVLGAIIGQEFHIDLVEAVRPDVGLNAVEEAVDANFLRESSEQIGVFRFSHALVRGAILARVSATRRVRLHRQVGEVLATTPGTPPLLVAHQLCAGVPAGGSESAAAWALTAASDAFTRLAFEEGADVAGLALDALSRSKSTRGDLRAQLLLARATSLHFGGRIDAALADARTAAAEAQQAGEAHLLAMAAAQTLTWPLLGNVDMAADIALAKHALTMLGDADLQGRTCLLSMLALHQAVGEGRGAAAAPLAQEAVSVARRTGDPSTLGSTLLQLGLVLQGSPDLAPQVAVISELADLVQTPDFLDALPLLSWPTEWALHGKHSRVLNLARLRTVCALQAGDIPSYQEAVADIAAIVDTASTPYPATLLHMWSAMRVLAEGRIDEAQGFADEMAAKMPGNPNFSNSWTALAFQISRERGGAFDLVPVLESAVSEFQAVVVFQALLALALVDGGEADQARPMLLTLAKDEFGGFPRDLTWSMALAILSEVCAAVRDRETAVILRGLLDPYAGQLIVAAWGVFCPGASDRYIGMLEALLGNTDEALDRFGLAVDLEERAGFSALATRTRLWWAKTQIASGASAGQTRAMLETVNSDAVGLGMAAVAREAKACLHGLR